VTPHTLWDDGTFGRSSTQRPSPDMTRSAELLRFWPERPFITGCQRPVF